MGWLLILAFFAWIFVVGVVIGADMNIDTEEEDAEQEAFIRRWEEKAVSDEKVIDEWQSARCSACGALPNRISEVSPWGSQRQAFRAHRQSSGRSDMIWC